MFDRNPSQSEVRDVMQTLRGLGAAKIEVHFSGGNDEGGADGVTVFAADGTTITLPEGRAYENRYWQNGREHNEGWTVWDRDIEGGKRPATPEEVKWSKVDRVIEYPIYDQYGSFAGEFYVDGTLTWDVAAGTHEMHGHMENRSWDEF